MQQLALMELFGAQSKSLSVARAKTSEAVGESLFQSLLKEESSASTHLAGNGRKDPSPSRQKELGLSAFLMGALRLPQDAVPRLTAYFEKCGLSREKIDLLIRSATDKEGNVHLGPLFSQLDTAMNLREKARKELIVEASQVPKVEKLLQDSGLGVGQVKALMESSVNRDGALVVNRLQKAIAEIFPGNSQPDLPLLLKQAKIPYRFRETESNLNKETVKHLIKDDQGQPVEKIKEQLAVLLRDKGVAPEEAKSFLETVSVRSLKSFAEADGGTPWDLHGLKDLLKKAKIGTHQDWQRKDSDEPFLRVLRGGERGAAEDSKSGFRLADSKGTAGLRLDNNQAPGATTNKAGQEPFIESMRMAQGGRAVGKKTGRGDITAQPVVNQAGSSISGANTVDSGGSAASTGRQSTPETVPNILEKMVWMAHAGQQKSRIQLSPPELGRLDVHLVVDKGHLSAHIGAESLAAKEILDSNLSQLRQQLTHLGFVVDRFEVMVGLEQQGSGKGEDLFHEQGRRGASSKEGRRLRAVENVLNGAEQHEVDRGDHQVNMLV